jgi:PAS domain S-box-containing protein
MRPQNITLTWTEEDRLAALHDYGILDTPREAEFDDITQMAAQACGCHMSTLNLLDRDRQWFKAEVGIGVQQMPSEPSLCHHALREAEALVVPDTRVDPRLANNPLVLGPPFARFYAGVPLRTPEGLPIGALCVVDQQPRELTEQQLFILKALARAVMARLEQRKAIAERDQALLAERQTEARSQQILNSAIDYAIISFDLQGRVTSWNEGARRILGWAEQDMLGQPADRFFTPEDVAAGRPALEMGEALRTGRGNDERWHMRQDGTRFFASGEMMALRAAAGTITGFIKILRDRTEQRVASQALRDSRERIETALGTGLVGFFDWDVATGQILADERFAELYGLDAARLAQGMPIDDVAEVIHPEDREAVTRNVAAAISGCADYTKQFRVAGAGRKTRSLLVRGRCYERGDDRALRFTGIAIDISAAAEAEEALRASEAFNQQVLASSSDCIKVLDLDGSLQFMSEGGKRTMEMEDFSPYAGCPWLAFWEGPEKGLALAALATAKAGSRGHFQGYADTAKGNRRYWDVVVTPMLGRDGRPERLLSISRDVTEAQAAGERIELALNAGAILGTWVWDITRDRFTSDSRFAATFLLDPAAMALGVPLKEVVQSIHLEDLPHAEERIGQAMSQGGRYRAEYRVRRIDGSWRWIEANGFCELDGNGKATRFPGVLIDINARKCQELRQTALIELGNQLRALRDPAAMAAAASVILGQTLGVTRAGYGSVDSVQEIVGVGQDWRSGPEIVSIAGQHAFRTFGSYIEDLKRNEVVAIPDAARDPRTREGAAALEALQIRSLLNVPLMDEGRLAAIVLVNSMDEHAWAEEEIAFAQAVADRTWAAIEQAKAEAELLRINETLEAQVAERTQERDGIWNASQDLLGVADMNGIWLSVSPAWTELLGWRREEIVGRTSEWMEHPDDRADTRAEIGHLVEGRRTMVFENRFRTHDGSYRSLSWVAVPVEGRLYCSARDVTEQKAAADSLARTEQALRQSQKMEAVGQLTGGLAHDFNNLLTGITGALELLEARVAQGRYKDVGRYLQAAQGAAKRAAALTHRLLAFSRQQTLDPRPTNVNDLVAGMEELIRRTVGPAIEVQVVGAEAPWPTLVDPNQLENAVLNLCINARDAMPDGGRLTIEMANLDLDARSVRDRDLSPGQYMAISVTDTGSGMSPEVIAKAFDPFFTTKPLGQGTGLGLSMIYGFAKQSGGQVRIHSQEGMGTTMRIFMPRYLGTVEDAELPPDLADVPRAQKGETVLVVDDEPTIRMLVKEVLEELGYAAIEAADSNSGLAVLRSDARVDLLVTDVGLPGGMNGRQMADVARTGRPDLKVLFITGYAENAVLGNGHLDSGMHVMTKPFTLEALAGRIKELIAAP